MENNNYNYDLIVIGAGPGGAEAAAESVKYGMRTALIESYKVGGTCLNRGCIPTKALMRSSDAYREIREYEDLGIDLGGTAVYPDGEGGIKPNYERIYKRKEAVLATLREGISKGLKRGKVDLIYGHGRIVGEHEVEVVINPAVEGEAVHIGEAETLTADKIIIATGSRAAMPPVKGTDLPGVITSTELLELEGAPYDTLAIVGGGVIGAEFATVFNDLGTKVVILEATDRLIPRMDKELGRSLKTALQQQGIEIHTSAAVSEITAADQKNRDGSFKLNINFNEKGGECKITADKVLISTGRRPNTDDLFDDEIAEKYNFIGERRFMNVNEAGRTSCAAIYAIGDIVPGMQLAHTAAAQARNAVADINGHSLPDDMSVVPACIYSRPEIASVGMTQDEAKRKDIDIITKKYAMGANGKTVLEGLGRGFIKIVARKSDEVIIGAQLMCGRATDLAGELALAIRNGLTLGDIASTIHPHPTFTEAIGEASRL